MKFEDIKTAAIREYVNALTKDWELRGDMSQNVLLPFFRMTSGDHEVLRDFANLYENPDRRDVIAHMAKNGNEWERMVLKAREAGRDLINNWDVRKVKTLIDLFPGCVAKQYRNAEITVYMADNEDCDLMVDFNPAKRNPYSRPRLR